MKNRLQAAYKLLDEMHPKAEFPDQHKRLHAIIKKSDGYWAETFNEVRFPDLEEDWVHHFIEVWQDMEMSKVRLSVAEQVALSAQHNVPVSMTGSAKLPIIINYDHHLKKHVTSPNFSSRGVLVMLLRFSGGVQAKNIELAMVSMTNQAADYMAKKNMAGLTLLSSKQAESFATKEPKPKILKLSKRLAEIGSYPIFFCAGIEGAYGSLSYFRALYEAIKQLSPEAASKTCFIWAIHPEEIEDYKWKENDATIISDGNNTRWCFELELEKFVMDPSYHRKAAWLTGEMQLRVEGREGVAKPGDNLHDLVARRAEVSKHLKRYKRYGQMGRIEGEATE